MAALVVTVTSAAPAGPATPSAIGTLRVADAEAQITSLDAPGVLYLVDVWVLGCRPCMQEMPELDRLAKEYEPSGRFRLVSVVGFGWRGKGLLSVARDAETTRPLYSDKEDWLSRLGINAYPTKLLIRDGKLLRRAVGGGEGAYEKWKTIVENELKSSTEPSGR